MLVLNYLHAADTNPDLDVRHEQLPLLGEGTLGDDESGSESWGHAGNALMSALRFEQTMWYGASIAVDRILRFRNSSVQVNDYIRTGVGRMTPHIGDPLFSTALASHNARMPFETSSLIAIAEREISR